MGGLLNTCCGPSTDEFSNEVLIDRKSRNSKRNNEQEDTDYRDSETQEQLSRAEAYRRVLTFKDFKGFKTVKDIHEHYRFYKALGKGSFGEVLCAEHIKAKVPCAVKVIRKKSIEKHDILVELMHNELKVLEETAHPHIMRIFELLEDE